MHLYHLQPEQSHLENKCTFRGKAWEFHTGEATCSICDYISFLSSRRNGALIDCFALSFTGFEIWPGYCVSVLCSQARHFTFTEPFSTQEHEWVLVTCQGKTTKYLLGGDRGGGELSIPSRAGRNTQVPNKTAINFDWWVQNLPSLPFTKDFPVFDIDGPFSSFISMKPRVELQFVLNVNFYQFSRQFTTTHLHSEVEEKGIVWVP